MKDSRSVLAALVALGTLTALAGAGARSPAPGETAEWTRSTAVVSIGAFDAEHAGQRATEAGVQYRLRWKSRVLRPVVGAMGTSAGAVNVFAGLSVEVSAGRRLGFRGSFAPGYYTPGRAGKDLGYALEFRSGFEVAVALDGGWHINPGQESLVLTLAVPVGRRRTAADGSAAGRPGPG